MIQEELALQFLLLPASRRVYDRVAMRRPIPDLFHYTTSAGLAGILASRTIWATEARYLNDTSELVYAETLIRETLAAEISSVPAEYQPWLSEFTRVVGRVIADTQFFVASFCAEGDLLSQWRGYASSGSCLHFAGPPFAQLPDCHVVRVEYDPDVQRQTIRETLSVHLAAIERARDTGYQAPINRVSGNFGAQLSLYASCFKNPAFSEEREWRAITSNAVHPVRYRSAYGMRVPYVEIPLAGVEKSLPLVGVVQSPLAVGRTELGHVKKIVTDQGYDISLVKSSAIPLRAEIGG